MVAVSKKIRHFSDRQHSNPNSSLILTTSLSNLDIWIVPFGFPNWIPCVYWLAKASLVLRLIKSRSSFENNEKSVIITFFGGPNQDPY